LISRFYLKDYLSFQEVELEFSKGLVVFTGASGAGKSVLMSSLLALFGITEAKAKLSEATLENLSLSYESYDIKPNDDIIIKQITQSKTRYLLNNQTISKKNLKQFTLMFSKHLHLKDTTDFKSQNILELIDNIGTKKDKNYSLLLEQFTTEYKKYITYTKELQKLQNDEQELDRLIEFTKFEIDQIEKIDPKPNEYDELKVIKTNLSKKDKLEDILKEVEPFLQNTHKISTALNMIDIDSSFFDDTINELHSHFEKFQDSISNVEENNIEEILTRIEDLSKLNKKYGGIEEALEYKEQKKKELQGYENITFEKAMLEKKLTKLTIILDDLSAQLTSFRKIYIKQLQDKIGIYLDLLYLENLTVNLVDKSLDITGADKVEFLLNNTKLDKISSGEFNRLRLALLTARSYYDIDTNGILFLDEIDANLSGKESQSIAKVLAQLSKNYQIFAISHQPQLSATAQQHFLVKKQDNISRVTLLDHNQRIDEIARMISGENITKEAKEFAKKLL
jgi:DNA repair protein RecN (Recombination protein N)